ncbi:MAG: Rpn family recombination-promoting nuclease/putative transposase [Chitinispirillales bacterium]|nr:Rpn family recombination-promoting nuclease/putative transposase [Chitinispirillales bacterium]
MPIKYLDPKNDLTFKRIFGEHKHLCMSLLNNLLKFEGSDKIESLEYQTPEMLPELELLKYSIVDVKCVDGKGRAFIVEMQLYWSNSFRARALLNTAKAYSRQLDSAKKYSDLSPVFSLCLVNDIIENTEEFSDKYYWEYGIREKYHDKYIPGLDFVFIELPKFKPASSTEKSMFDLWLQLLTQIDESKGGEIPQELFTNDETREAIKYLKEEAYTKAQLEAYDQFRDANMRELSALHDAREEGIEIGEKNGAKKLAELIEKGIPLQEAMKKLGIN